MIRSRFTRRCKARQVALSAHATLINGPSVLADAVSLHQPEAAPVAALAEGLRRQFDPRGILNPGSVGLMQGAHFVFLLVP